MQIGGEVKRVHSANCSYFTVKCSKTHPIHAYLGLISRYLDQHVLEQSTFICTRELLTSVPKGIHKTGT
jgi:hypothetical protein